MGEILNWIKGVIYPCEVCNGSGKLPNNLKDDDVITCLACHGSGILDRIEKVKHFKEVPCDNPICENGKIIRERINNHTIIKEKCDCPVCDGLNRIFKEIEESYVTHHVCPVCSGTGLITALQMRNKHLEQLCPNCRGLGRKISKKKVLVLFPVGLLILVFPVLAFILFSFLGVVFSLYAIRNNKNRDLEYSDEINKLES